MKKFIKLILILCFYIIAVYIGTTLSEASSSDLYLNNLNFNAEIKNDGSMNVVETWDIDISSTNTLFKTFKTDSSKYSKITNVEVKDITGGKNKTLTKINQLMYHVKKDCYYGMINKNNEFEIAWGVGLENSSDIRKYEIHYTVEDAVSKHADYAQLYWQFVGKDFEISAKEITGTIKLPGTVQDLDEIKVWGHTKDLNGEIHATGNNEIKFNIQKYRGNRYVEVRTLFPTNLIITSNRHDSKEILNSVIDEEAKWVNKANAQRKRKKIIAWGITIIINILCFVLYYFIIRSMNKTIAKLKDMNKYKPTQELKYFREIPENNATPSQALYVKNKKISELTSNEIGKIFSATLLNLNRKKIIDFEIDKTDKKNITIKILKEDNKSIQEDEKVIFQFLKLACGLEKQITVKQLVKFIKRCSTTNIIKLKDNLEDITKSQLENKEIYNKVEKEKYDKYSVQIIGNIVIIMMLAIFSPILVFALQFANIFVMIGIIPLIILLIILTILKGRIASNINIYTQLGVDSSEKWKGLERYMKDFSLLKEREVPELAIWEEFLVYATTFGIAEKVLTQLKIVYPNIEEIMSTTDITYMYVMMNTNFSTNFSNAISSSMSSAYSSATGGGGGFSGGGGGRWPEEVEEEVDNPLQKYN